MGCPYLYHQGPILQNFKDTEIQICSYGQILTVNLDNNYEETRFTV